MTREQIRKKIEEIIHQHVFEIETDRWSYDLKGVDLASEEIMELWDKGFTYDVPD